MVSLFIGSTAEFSGKSLVCIGLGLGLKKDGFRIGYLKPLGTLPKKVREVFVDEDAFLVREVLRLEDDLEQICPVIFTPDLAEKAYEEQIEGLEEGIIKAHRTLSQNKDVVLIEGAADLSAGGFLGISGFYLVKRLKAKVILVDKYGADVHMDHILEVKEALGNRLMGVILNAVDPEMIDHIRELILPFLQRKGVDVFGILPYDTLLGSISVEELHSTLGGQVLCCQNKLGNLVECFSVGAMNLEKSLEVFRRWGNKAVIVGGDRPDIQLAALETSTRCIILTGNLYPSSIILAKAEERGVPMILVPEDTFTTVDRLEKVLGRLGVKNEAKIKRGAELIAQNMDLPLLYRKAGLVKE